MGQGEPGKVGRLAEVIAKAGIRRSGSARAKIPKGRFAARVLRAEAVSGEREERDASDDRAQPRPGGRG